MPNNEPNEPFDFETLTNLSDEEETALLIQEHQANILSILERCSPNNPEGNLLEEYKEHWCKLAALSIYENLCRVLKEMSEFTETSNSTKKFTVPLDFFVEGVLLALTSLYVTVRRNTIENAPDLANALSIAVSSMTRTRESYDVMLEFVASDLAEEIAKFQKKN